MRSFQPTFLLLGLSIAVAPSRAQEALDRLAESLTFSSEQAFARARVGGSVELEGHYQSDPVSDLLFSDRHVFFNPRVVLNLDAQAGRSLYLFGQARFDRRFDPTDEGAFTVRLDEFALRYSPWTDGRFNVQIGQFATVAGFWARRHTAWENPFLNAPLPYENLTAAWDRAAPASAAVLLEWGHVRPVSDGAAVSEDKDQRLPMVWGPSYATGVAVAGTWREVEYAVELKNASLSSRPEIWNDDGDVWDLPTLTGRLGWRPNVMWNLGGSASGGSYLRPSAAPSLRPGTGREDYRQLALAHDVSFAWHHLQLWAEVWAARFELPGIGDADTLAYFVEGRVKLTPQLALALRWNQQTFDTIDDGAGRFVRWGREAWRIDLAPAYRFTPYVQLKLQFSLRHESPANPRYTHSIASQLTIRF